ncbi:hypothetical protein BDV96DRAFT_496181 [Lophiotrema nucula]|uniref:Glycoside hydrolase 131 catalytic N-terminal domain-containing protein n=1 Tax=Lophiotrema nucula TaxID=690887 RepID=A0A6A5Z5Q8_9PLEO|nr:hypothetical protein BDV96DRAFT_496181 [Lophiotrema nucula]
MFTRSLRFFFPYFNLSIRAAIVFDGRVPATAALADFDSANSNFDPDFTKGQTNSCSSQTALHLCDASIFAPGGSTPQTAVRRAELSPNPSLTPSNTTSTGIKTLHLSLQPSAQRPLNLSHEYLLVFNERADFSANQISLKTGTLLGSDGSTKGDLVVLGNSKDGGEELFRTGFEEGVFVNFALVMDFDGNTVQVFSSTGADPLTQQTEPLANDLSGNGALHFGINKNPTDPRDDVLRTGFQESGILEGVVYGGIFVEDSVDGTITLS